MAPRSFPGPLRHPRTVRSWSAVPIHQPASRRRFGGDAITGIQGLGFLPGDDTSVAFSCTADGSTVVGESSNTLVGTDVEAFIWTAGTGMVSLQDWLDSRGIDTTDWASLVRARDISPDGNFITGFGIRSGGQAEAFLIKLVGGGNQVEWIHSGNGNWDDPNNWSTGAVPTANDCVVINPAVGVTVFGPSAPTTIQKLDLNAQSGISKLNIQSFGNLTVAGTSTIGFNGSLEGAGNFVTDQLNGQGKIDLGDDDLSIVANDFSLSGLMCGSGDVDAVLQIEASGEVRITTGETIQVTGDVDNFGEINVLGGILDVRGMLVNHPNAIINGNGTVFTQACLMNMGVMAFTSATDIFGDIENASGGLIVVSGSATLTFFDDLLKLARG